LKSLRTEILTFVSINYEVPKKIRLYLVNAIIHFTRKVAAYLVIKISIRIPYIVKYNEKYLKAGSEINGFGSYIIQRK